MSDTANSPTVYGLDVPALATNEIPLEAIVLLKALDEDGDTTIIIRATDALNTWDRVGMLTVALDITRDAARDAWRDDIDDDD